MEMLYYGDVVKRLENAGFTVVDVRYDRSIRKHTDLRAFKGERGEVQDVLLTRLSSGLFDEREINNVIAGRHKYAGLTFGVWPADAGPNHTCR